MGLSVLKVEFGVSVKPKWVWRVFIFLIGVSLVIGVSFLFSSAEPAPILKVRLKRYGKSTEGLPVAWLLITNVSNVRAYLWGDLNPVRTAFCEYRQELPTGTTNWMYRPVSTSGGMSVRTNEEVAVRIFLPTNGVPTRVQLFTSRPTSARDPKFLRSLRMWFYRNGWASPAVKIPVPGELLHTNFVARMQ